MAIDRVILVVLDSVGIGAARDAARFGDAGAHTLQHIDEWCRSHQKKFSLPNLSAWGLGHLVPTPAYTVHTTSPQASFGKLLELSPGKDTTTGHWEMAGTPLKQEFPLFPEGFDSKLLEKWCTENQLPGWLGNKPASGTTVLQELGEEHLKTGCPIVYTSGDSVWQIACSEESFGLQRLYDICKSARIFANPLGVGRIIARPFTGKTPQEFHRTENRRDFSVPPPKPNLLDVLVEKKCFVAGVGKIEDIFAHRSVTLVKHTGRNETTLQATVDFMQETRGQRGLIFANLIDFDQLHGHRRNPETYAQALMDFDAFLPRLEKSCSPRDLMILTADHGNDPTHSGTDHTRENVPFLVWSPASSFRGGQDLGELLGFSTIARLTLESLGYGSEWSRFTDAQESPALAKQLGLST